MLWLAHSIERHWVIPISFSLKQHSHLKGPITMLIQDSADGLKMRLCDALHAQASLSTDRLASQRLVLAVQKKGQVGNHLSTVRCLTRHSWRRYERLAHGLILPCQRRRAMDLEKALLLPPLPISAILASSLAPVKSTLSTQRPGDVAPSSALWAYQPPTYIVHFLPWSTKCLLAAVPKPLSHDQARYTMNRSCSGMT